MRALLILGGIGILSTAAWTVTADTGSTGYGPLHGLLGLNSLEGPMRQQGSGYVEHTGLFSAHPSTVGGPGPMITGHLVGPAIHPLAHVVGRIERLEAVAPQPPAPTGAAAPGAAELDQSGAASAQPNPISSPSLPRPPGALGPGRPVSGSSGPGLPGPGRPARPRW
jgi:hypothetical protein